jgi:hypothetical protein
MDQMQRAPANPDFDRAPADPMFGELPARHHAMLTLRQRRDHRIHRRPSTRALPVFAVE